MGQPSEELPMKIDNEEEYNDQATLDESDSELYNYQATIDKSDSELSIEETRPKVHDPDCFFKREYNCFPLSHINKTHLEDGNRILVPVSALDPLMSMNIKHPMVFEIRNRYSNRTSHCGVLEFSAEEGLVFLPDWMMKNLQLQEGNLVTLKSATLPKGSFMKIQPHAMKFLRSSNPKSALETALRNFSCLTTGDTIMLTYNQNQYYFDIMETKPSGAISVVDTDCEVDFAPPLDYKEPEKKPKAVISPIREADKATEDMGKEGLKFRPFTGVTRCLDGQSLIAPVESNFVSTSTVKEDGLVAADSHRPRKHPGKLVFGPESQSWGKLRVTRIHTSRSRRVLNT